MNKLLELVGLKRRKQATDLWGRYAASLSRADAPKAGDADELADLMPKLGLTEDDVANDLDYVRQVRTSEAEIGRRGDARDRVRKLEKQNADILAEKERVNQELNERHKPIIVELDAARSAVRVVEWHEQRIQDAKTYRPGLFGCEEISPLRPVVKHEFQIWCESALAGTNDFMPGKPQRERLAAFMVLRRTDELKAAGYDDAAIAERIEREKGGFLTPVGV